MTYTPTKEELEKLGFMIKIYDFSKDDTECRQDISEIVYESYAPNLGKKLEYSKGNWYHGYDDVLFSFYPQSLEDIKTLIRLLTPHEN